MTYRALQIVLALQFYGTCGIAFAYEVDTHRLLSRAAAIAWIADDPTALNRLGLLKPIDDKSQILPNQRNEGGSVLEIIQDGAAFEDDGLRPLNHFFNPVTGLGLSVSSPTNISYPPSPDWALEDISTILDQNNSYRDARAYFWNALTVPDSSYRRQNLGLLFQSMGQIIHHLQDMAQPQHVRNDPHCDSIGCRVIRQYNPSLYEKYTQTLLTLPVDGYPIVYAVRDPNSFAVPRKFWVNSGKGIAEYTNQGFVSAGTNFSGTIAAPQPAPGLPSPNGAGSSVQVVTGAYLRQNNDCFGDPLPSAISDTDELWFISTPVHDTYISLDDQNPRTSTFSIFDDALTKKNKQPVFSLNRFNFCEAHKLLLPRAVAFSAGLLRFFFRGQMDIGLPGEGVYAIADQSPSSCVGACGFRKIELLLKNTTPGNALDGSGVMRAGKLYAIVKFHNNRCYQPDLSGEYGGSNFQDVGCRIPANADDFIAVSSEIPVADGDIADTAKPFSFDFSANPIPFSASDLYLQVVFRGQLGQEPDAIAVATKDIAEPNYLAVLNLTDYVFDDTGDHRYHPLGYQGINSDVTYNNVGIGFAGATTPIISLAQFRGGQFARLAFLTDIADLPTTIFYASVQTGTWTVQPEEFKQDDTTGNQYTRSCSVFAERGLYWEYLYFYHQSVSDHSLGSGRTIAKNASVDGPIGRLASTGQTGPRFAAKYDHDCAVDNSGIDDFSTPEQGPMSPLTAPSALPWTSITF